MPFVSAPLRLLVALLRLSLCLNGSAPSPQATPAAHAERRLAAMGTVLDISVAGPDRQTALERSESAVKEIARVEDLLTTWRPGGPLQRLNAAKPDEAVTLAPELASILSDIFEWSERTEGAFDPTVLPLVRAWDLRGGGRVPGREELSRALAATGRRHFFLDSAKGRAVRLGADAGIDEGAWGKGYALDRAVAVLKEGGVREALLDLGGQVSVVGRATIAIADPRDRRRAAASLDIVDESASTSGNSERKVRVGRRTIGHLLDPRTGHPAADFGSVTVVASSGLAADVLSTAFFVLGPCHGLEVSEDLRRRGFENRALFLVVANGRLQALASPGLRFRLEEE